MMSFDLVLKTACDGCKSTTDLYGSACKHATLCLSCGKKSAKEGLRCSACNEPITKLIREYNVRASSNTDKTYYIGRFITGIPPFSKKKSAENKWTLHKEGFPGRQLTDAQREKYKNRPWILEDETGQHQFQGQLEGAQVATYYLLMLQGREFVAMPSGSWYNFNKIAQYKQLTLEEAEEKMNKRSSNATGYQRWMMKAATNGSAAFGEKPKNEELGGIGNGRSKKGKSDADGDDHSDRGEEDVDEETDRKNRLGLNKKSADDDEDGGKVSDLDLYDVEKGDDWEHEEFFTDDDEAVGIDPLERDDLEPEMPAPPEIKQDDDEDEEEGVEKEGGLSNSGKELKKLLGRLNESDAEEDDDDYDGDDEAGYSLVLAPKQKDAMKEEPLDSSPAKAAAPSSSTKGTPSASKSSKAKRKPGNEDAKVSNGTTSKKLKTESESKPLPVKVEVKAESSTPPKSAVSAKNSASASSKTGAGPSSGPVTEEEIRNVLMTMSAVTTQELVAKFRARLKSQEDKSSFADILRGISKIQKLNGQSYVVLRDK